MNNSMDFVASIHNFTILSEKIYNYHVTFLKYEFPGKRTACTPVGQVIDHL